MKINLDPITRADWAIREHRFAPYFSLLKDDDPAPLPIADYLKLEGTARRGKTPIVTVVTKKNDDNEEITRWRVKPELVVACEERLDAWRTLQELAGLVTPFTQDVEAKLKQQMADAHQADLANLKQEYEARIENLRAEMEAEFNARVQNRLMNLAGYAN